MEEFNFSEWLNNHVLMLDTTDIDNNDDHEEGQ